MIRLVAAAALVFVSLLACALAADHGWPRHDARTIAALTTSLLLAPTLAFWAGAELVQLLSPRRTLDPRHRSPLHRPAAGITGALLAAAIAAIGLVFLDHALPDALITALPAALTAAAAVALMPRQRAGTCWSCGYDLSGATPREGAACPECGENPLMARNTSVHSHSDGPPHHPCARRPRHARENLAVAGRGKLVGIRPGTHGRPRAG